MKKQTSKISTCISGESMVEALALGVGFLGRLAAFFWENDCPGGFYNLEIGNMGIRASFTKRYHLFGVGMLNSTIL